MFDIILAIAQLVPWLMFAAAMLVLAIFPDRKR